MTTDWVAVESLFSQHGSVMAGKPEIRWFETAWGALEAAGLTDSTALSPELDSATVPKLRAICLLAMYLGIYQAAGEFSRLGGYFSEHSYFGDYLDALGVDTEELWFCMRETGMLETDVESFWEDGETDEDLLFEIAKEFVKYECASVYRALVGHFGGKGMLFAALWNSRLPREEQEPCEVGVDLSDYLPEKTEIWAYIEEGMANWSWD